MALQDQRSEIIKKASSKPQTKGVQAGVSGYDLQVDMARKLFLNYDAEAIQKKFGLDSDDHYLYVLYLGQQHRISLTTGAIEAMQDKGWKECRSYTVVMTIYDMLCRDVNSPLPALSGNWTPVGRFAAAGASPGTDYFTKKYAKAFEGKADALKLACRALGGELLPALAGADVTARIPAFSFFPVLLQFWDGDDEFPAQIKILWDTQTLQYLKFETTYYLQGDLLDALAAHFYQ